MHGWWSKPELQFLNDVIAFWNSARRQDDSISRCDDLCKAMNKVWTAHYQHRRKNVELNEIEIENAIRNIRADNQSLQELLLHGLSDEGLTIFCSMPSIRELAEFTPQIMNQDTLLKHEYDPCEISDFIRGKATEEHRQLAKAFTACLSSAFDNEHATRLLKKIAKVLYIVRNNIAHSEKTPGGPDIKKAERDHQVTKVASAVLEDFLELHFESPSQNLAVYGTLVPGMPNSSKLESLAGTWIDGTVEGCLEKEMGLSRFAWIINGNHFPVKIVRSERLQSLLPELDRFEGPLYERILVPAIVDGKLTVCNIYQGKEKHLAE